MYLEKKLENRRAILDWHVKKPLFKILFLLFSSNFINEKLGIVNDTVFLSIYSTKAGVNIQ